MSPLAQEISSQCDRYKHQGGYSKVDMRILKQLGRRLVDEQC